MDENDNTPKDGALSASGCTIIGPHRQDEAQQMQHRARKPWRAAKKQYMKVKPAQRLWNGNPRTRRWN